MLNPDISECENSIDADQLASLFFLINIHVNILKTSSLLDRI